MDSFIDQMINLLLLFSFFLNVYSVYGNYIHLVIDSLLLLVQHSSLFQKHLLNNHYNHWHIVFTFIQRFNVHPSVTCITSIDRKVIPILPFVQHVIISLSSAPCCHLSNHFLGSVRQSLTSRIFFHQLTDHHTICMKLCPR